MTDRAEPWASFKTMVAGEEAFVVYDRENCEAWVKSQATVAVRQ